MRWDTRWHEISHAIRNGHRFLTEEKGRIRMVTWVNVSSVAWPLLVVERRS